MARQVKICLGLCTLLSFPFLLLLNKNEINKKNFDQYLNLEQLPPESLTYLSIFVSSFIFFTNHNYPIMVNFFISFEKTSLPDIFCLSSKNRQIHKEKILLLKTFGCSKTLSDGYVVFRYFSRHPQTTTTNFYYLGMESETNVIMYRLFYFKM